MRVLCWLGISSRRYLRNVSLKTRETKRLSLLCQKELLRLSQIPFSPRRGCTHIAGIIPFIELFIHEYCNVALVKYLDAITDQISLRQSGFAMRNKDLFAYTVARTCYVISEGCQERHFNRQTSDRSLRSFSLVTRCTSERCALLDVSEEAVNVT